MPLVFDPDVSEGAALALCEADATNNTVLIKAFMLLRPVACDDTEDE